MEETFHHHQRHESDKTQTPFSGPAERRSNMRQALPQILAVCVKNVLLLGFGMTLGFPTILIPSLSGHNPEETFHLGQEAISWIGSINLICVPVGCLMSGMITQPIGRKRAMQLVNIPFLCAWLLFYFSTEVWHVFLALAITGVAGGLLEAPVLTYVAEITQPHLRGTLSSTSSMSVILGVAVEFFLGTALHWRTVTLANCAVPILAFVLLALVPETPIWLVSKHRYLDARKSLAWLRGWTALAEVELEFQDMCKRLGKAHDIGIDGPAAPPPAPRSRLERARLYGRRSFLWPLALVAFCFFLGHFNGMTTLQTYAIPIFATLRSPINTYYATVVLGLSELLGCVLCVSLVHSAGKRAVTLASLLGCGACFLAVGALARLDGALVLEAGRGGGGGGWLPTALLITFAFLAHLGIRILPWILTGEVFSNETRAVGAGVSAAVGYVFSFTINKVFFTVISLLTLPGTFWLYSGVSFFGAAVLYFALPETEGKCLHDIEEHFAGNAKLGNDVLRRKAGEVNEGFAMDEGPNKAETRVSKL